MLHYASCHLCPLGEWCTVGFIKASSVKTAAEAENDANKSSKSEQKVHLLLKNKNCELTVT